MQTNKSSQSTLLKIVNYVIHFPTGYKFVLRVPQEITVQQITEIMKSYTALHNVNGLTAEGKPLQPMVLSSLDKNIVTDLYLSDHGLLEHELTPLLNTQFKIQYATEPKSFASSTCQSVLCYEFVGRISRNEDFFQNERPSEKSTYIVRSIKNCKLYMLHKFPKSLLSFHKLQGIIQMRDYFTKSYNNHNNSFVAIHHSFETQISLCIVTGLSPFQLSRVKIQNKYLMDSILSQIARIVHILQRDGVRIQRMELGDFWMDFKFQVHYCGLQEFKKKKEKQNEAICIQENPQNEPTQSDNFNGKMTKLLQELFKNCNVKFIQSYIPLFHWMKNNRISNYLEFLKYFTVTPHILTDANHDLKSKEILHSLIKNYTFTKIYDLNLQEKRQFSEIYKPRTNLFAFTEPRKSLHCEISSINKQNEQKPRKIFDEIIENISTIKKKKNEVIVCTKPMYLARQFLKERKLKAKTKPKTNHLSQNLNKSSKTNKSKKHQRRISQFLIDD